jgi:hypothetical protein
MLAASLDQLNFYRDPGFGARRILRATAFRPWSTASFHLRTSLACNIPKPIAAPTVRNCRRRREIAWPQARENRQHLFDIVLEGIVWRGRG